ncbi:MAG: tRNA 4-thiouridine(8) synthase ThiI [Candidatus Omnitrophota bacterium]
MTNQKSKIIKNYPVGAGLASVRDKKNIRALGLLSGGLDSILAVKVLQQQGIEVTGLSFTTPFFGSAAAEKAAEALGIELLIEDITEEHFEMVKNPPHGYGKTMNPCIDCHAMMVNAAGKIMKDKGFDFIFTGEVLDERPMSQNRGSLEVVAKTSGYKGYLLRPLSAKLLNPIIPEQNGLIDRDKLLDLRGRSRKRQFALAEEFNVTEYPNPAGGCLLTDRGFSQRLKELLSKEENPSIKDVRMLRAGRHFRFSDTVKLLVGRDEKDNKRLEDLYDGSDYIMDAGDIPGPICVLTGIDAQLFLNKAAAICASYSDIDEGSECLIMVRRGEHKQQIKVIACKDARDQVPML